MTAKKANSKLSKFLRKYSTCAVKHKLGPLYKQWRLIEVRDVGHKYGLRCHCGHGNLRYLCFIRNTKTKVQTYVGSTCIRYFANPIVPKMVMTMETLARTGILAQYIKRTHKTHHFRIQNRCCLVRQNVLLQHFFSKLPFYRTSSGWRLQTTMGYTRTSKPRLTPGQWYRIKLGAVTSSAKRQRPRLIFLCDRVVRSNR